MKKLINDPADVVSEALRTSLDMAGCSVTLLRADDELLRLNMSRGMTAVIAALDQSARPFSVGNTMGRNKIIYGLARSTIVAASDEDSGDTWGRYRGSHSPLRTRRVLDWRRQWYHPARPQESTETEVAFSGDACRSDPLTDAGIIAEFTDHPGNRAWRLPEILSALDEFAARF